MFDDTTPLVVVYLDRQQDSYSMSIPAIPSVVAKSVSNSSGDYVYICVVKWSHHSKVSIHTVRTVVLDCVDCDHYHHNTESQSTTENNHDVAEQTKR